MHENNELKSLYLHIDKDNVEYIKKLEKDKKVGIENLSSINKTHFNKMFEDFGNHTVFRKSETKKIIDLKSAGTSKLLKILLNKGIIVQVKGYGKGKYKFNL